MGRAESVHASRQLDAGTASFEVPAEPGDGDHLASALPVVLGGLGGVVQALGLIGSGIPVCLLNQQQAIGLGSRFNRIQLPPRALAPDSAARARTLLRSFAQRQVSTALFLDLAAAVCGVASWPANISEGEG